MKTRIIQDSEWQYMVQKRYKLRPFWLDDTYSTCFEWMSLDNWYKSLNKAKIRELEIHRDYNYKKIYKVCE